MANSKTCMAIHILHQPSSPCQSPVSLDSLQNGCKPFVHRGFVSLTVLEAKILQSSPKYTEMMNNYTRVHE